MFDQDHQSFIPPDGAAEGSANPDRDAVPPPDSLSIPTISAEMIAPQEAADTGVDFERGMSYLPRLTLLIIAANVVVFVLEVAYGALSGKESIIHAGALYRPGVARGEVWRFFSAMFLHGGFDHLFGNCVALFIVGMAMEHAAGWKRSAGLYLASGLSGGVLSLAFSEGPSVGASGAIFGVLGGVVAFLYKNRSQYQVRDKRIGFVLVIWALYQLGSGFLTPLIDNFAHLGGLMAGAFMGWTFPVSEERLSQARAGHL